MSTLPCLQLPVKVPPRYDLVQPLANWLDDEDAQNEFGSIGESEQLAFVMPKPAFSSVECRSDLLRLAALRNCLSESLLNGKEELELSLKDCMDYHATLLEFTKRGFPTTDTSYLQSSWYGAFDRKEKETHQELLWDRACTMWNAVALQSQLVKMTDLTSKDSCKKCIQWCQSGASILQVLQEMVEESSQYATIDFSAPMLSFWHSLLLAQGQAIIYKMANLGDSVRQHTTLAYLANGAAQLFAEALEAAQDPRLQSEVPQESKDWAIHCKLSSMLFASRAEFHLAIDYRQQQTWGLEIARLTNSVNQMVEVQAFLKDADLEKSSWTAQVEGLARLSRQRWKQATEDNVSIYSADIPGELPEVRAQVMIKKDQGLPEEMLIPKANLFAFEDK